MKSMTKYYDADRKLNTDISLQKKRKFITLSKFLCEYIPIEYLPLYILQKRKTKKKVNYIFIFPVVVF